MKRIAFVFVALFTTLISVYAQNIRINGFVTDTELKAPAEFANVVLQTTDSAFVTGVTTDEKGRFQLNGFSAGSYRLLISTIGYTTNVTELEGLTQSINLGELFLRPEAIELESVTVTASNIINHADRKVIFPNQKQLESSTNGINILQSMMLPRILVNPLTNEIKSMDEGQIQLRINGVEVSNRELMALQPQDILRIEFLENPGLRYGNASIVLNYITRRHDSGGSLSIDLSDSPDLNFTTNMVAGKFNYKKSEFALSYVLDTRDFDEFWRDNEETFHFVDGSVLNRKEEGQPGSYVRQTHNARLNYNYKPSDKAYFNASFNYTGNVEPHSDYHSILHSSQYPNQGIRMNDLTDRDRHSPSLDLYYMRALEKKQTIVFNLVGTYNKSSLSRTYQEILDNNYMTDVSSHVKGEKYSLIGEGIYEKQLEKGRISAGLKHTQSSTDNTYSGTIGSKTEMKQADSYAYAEYQGKIKKLTYTVGLGVSRSWLKQEGEESYSF